VEAALHQQFLFHIWNREHTILRTQFQLQISIRPVSVCNICAVIYSHPDTYQHKLLIFIVAMKNCQISTKNIKFMLLKILGCALGFLIKNSAKLDN
jgi:hypothetical protein